MVPILFKKELWSGPASPGASPTSRITIAFPRACRVLRDLAQMTNILVVFILYSFNSASCGLCSGCVLLFRLSAVTNLAESPNVLVIRTGRQEPRERKRQAERCIRVDPHMKYSNKYFPAITKCNTCLLQKSHRCHLRLTLDLLPLLFTFSSLRCRTYNTNHILSVSPH